MGGRSLRKPYRFSSRDIAEAAGCRLRHVRNLIRNQVINPNDLQSIAGFVTLSRQHNEAQARMVAQFTAVRTGATDWSKILGPTS